MEFHTGQGTLLINLPLYMCIMYELKVLIYIYSTELLKNYISCWFDFSVCVILIHKHLKIKMKHLYDLFFSMLHRFHQICRYMIKLFREKSDVYYIYPLPNLTRLLLRKRLKAYLSVYLDVNFSQETGLDLLK